MSSQKDSILKKIDWNKLNYYIDNNLIIANKHSEYDIYILNYSPKVKSKKIWDEYTSICRGLVVDLEGNILARPFENFEDIEEYDISEIPTTEEFDVFEKIDGSLIIVFYYKKYKEWIVTARGSFFSEQSIEARNMLDKKTLNVLRKNYTYLFEFIYPKNRIVVDYGNKKDLILLSRIDTKNGFEIYYDDLVDYYSKYFTIVEKINIKKIEDLLKYKKLNKENEEGVVVRFLNGFRLKIKFEEYVRLHGILTHATNLTIWEHMMKGYDFDELIDRVPKKFDIWLKKTKNFFQNKYNTIERKALLEFIKIYHINNITDRKLFSIEAAKSINRSILFRIYEKKQYDELIWEKIKPKHSKPFSQGHDIYS